MAAFAFPGVQPDMVVIAAGRNECGTGAHPLRQFEAKHAAIEAERAIEIGDLEMHMPDPCACDDGRIVGHVSLLRFRAPNAAQRLRAASRPGHVSNKCRDASSETSPAGSSNSNVLSVIDTSV